LAELAFNWLVVCCANFAGAVLLASLVFLSGHAQAYAVLVALVYYAIYRWPLRTTSTLEPSRRASDG